MDNNPIQNPTPNPLVNPVVPGAQPVQPVNNAPVPSAAQPVNPPVQAPVNPQPAVPPMNPVAMPNPNPVAPVQAPVNPIFQPTNNNGMAPTAPLTQPEPAPAPDPVEEELKSPMKAAAPVPGSIGSAVSGPEMDNAEMDNGMNAADTMQNMNKVVKPAKQGLNKTTLILIAIIGVIVVLGLAAYLLMQLNIIPSIF